jgi:autotransporter-associated beta strand protein
MLRGLAERTLGGRARRNERRVRERRRRRFASVEGLEDRRLLALLTWVGEVDKHWNTEFLGITNWDTNTLPQDGDTLVFPLLAFRYDLVNDTPTGNSYSLVFTGLGYSISGNSITLDGLSTDNLLGTNTLSTPLVLAQEMTTIHVGALGKLVLEGPIGQDLDGAGLTKTGTGKLVFSGDQGNSYDGPTYVSDGTLKLRKSTRNNDAILGALHVGDMNGDACSAVVDATCGNQISDSSAVTVYGDGHLRLDDDAIGPLTIQDGTVDSGSSVGFTIHGDLTMVGGLISGARRVQLDGNLSVRNFNPPGFLPLGMPDAWARIEAPLELFNETTLIDVEDHWAFNDLRITSAISERLPGSGFTKTGRGRLLLDGADANTYTGTTRVDDGELALDKLSFNGAIPGNLVVGDGVGDLGSARVVANRQDQIADVTSVTVHGDGQLFVWGYEAIAALDVDGGWVFAWDANLEVLGATTLTGGHIQGGTLILRGNLVTCATGATSEINSNIDLGGEREFKVKDGSAFEDLRTTGALSNGEVIKRGAGTWGLRGESPNFSMVRVAGGAVLADDLSLAGAILLDGGKLGGRINSSFGIGAMPNGGILAPGFSPGTITTGILLLNAATTYQVEIDGPLPGLLYDQTIVSGQVDLGGATLDIVLSGMFPTSPGTKFVIIDHGGTDPILGQFAGLPNNTVFTVGTTLFRIRYDGGDGNDVVLQVLGPPVAVNDIFATPENIPLSGNVAANDQIPAGVQYVTQGVTLPTNGTLVLFGNGDFNYTPRPNFSGVDTFTYQIYDGVQTSNVATVTIYINAVNEPPIARDDAYTLDEGATLSVIAPGVLANDNSPEGLGLSAILVYGPSHGTLVLNPDGSFAYTPHDRFTGTDSFAYRASDGSLQSNLATVFLNVQPIRRTTVRLDPKSDTGVSKTDRITKDNTPTFLGKTAPFLSVRLSIQNGTVVGTAMADANGSFVVTSRRLPDGEYRFAVDAFHANGRSTGRVDAGPLLIDTKAPVVTGAVMFTPSGQIYIGFKDNRSGMNQRSLANRGNYSLYKPGSAQPTQAVAITKATVMPEIEPDEEQTVVLRVGRGRPIGHGSYLFTAIAGGIQDRAGNALDGEYRGRFPTGNGRAGGNFRASFTVPYNSGNGLIAPKPTNGFAPIIVNDGSNPTPGSPLLGPGGPLAFLIAKRKK